MSGILPEKVSFESNRLGHTTQLRSCVLLTRTILMLLGLPAHEHFLCLCAGDKHNYVVRCIRPNIAGHLEGI